MYWQLCLHQSLAILFIYTRMSQLRGLDSEQVSRFPLNSGVLSWGSQVSITSVSKGFSAGLSDNSCPHLEHLEQVSSDWHETWLRIVKHNHSKLHAFPVFLDIRSYLYISLYCKLLGPLCCKQRMTRCSPDILTL